jgi:hypothetical protein
MGGVLSRLLVSSSEDKLWEALLDSYPMQGAQQTRIEKRLAPYLRFEPLPQVSDAIFIASPHRGTPTLPTTAYRAGWPTSSRCR